MNDVLVDAKHESGTREREPLRVYTRGWCEWHQKDDPTVGCFCPGRREVEVRVYDL